MDKKNDEVVAQARLYVSVGFHSILSSYLFLGKEIHDKGREGDVKWFPVDIIRPVLPALGTLPLHCPGRHHYHLQK